MINLPVSEAEAFDYLIILEVKKAKGLNIGDRRWEIQTSLFNQCPQIEAVLVSQAYLELLQANAACFDAIEAAHKDAISASDVQRINHRRYLAKKALQERFWPAEPLSEKKTLV